MKASALWLPVVCAVLMASPAVAQRGGSGGSGGRTSALGGSLAPRGAMTHPLGGFVGPSPGVGLNRSGGFRGTQGAGAARRSRAYPYGYSYYVPNYFDYLNSDYSDPNYGGGYGYAAAPPAPLADSYAGNGPSAGPQQPVIINQYFGMQQPAQDNGPDSIRDTLGAPGDVLGSVQNYYLIAYKNHAIYSALAYWVEDNTLHYVTTQNSHNQASLDLIDLALTKSLNQARDVPFAIAGR